MDDDTVEAIADLAVTEILDRGLYESTWRDLYPEAYQELLLYREDIKISILNSIRRRNL